MVNCGKVYLLWFLHSHCRSQENKYPQKHSKNAISFHKSCPVVSMDVTLTSGTKYSTVEDIKPQFRPCILGEVCCNKPAHYLVFLCPKFCQLLGPRSVSEEYVLCFILHGFWKVEYFKIMNFKLIPVYFQIPLTV